MDNNHLHCYNKAVAARGAQPTGRTWQSVFFHIAFLSVLMIFFITPLYGQPANAAVQRGNEAYKKGDYNAAAKAYSQALEADKKNTAAWFNLGNALQKTMNADNAARSYDEVIRTAPDNDLRSKAYYNKGLSRIQQKDLQAAIDAFKQSLRLVPGDNEARENLQKALNEQKKQQQQQQQQQSSSKQQQQKQKQQKMMDKQMMEQKFRELRNQEKELQKQLQQQRTSTQQQEKDW